MSERIYACLLRIFPSAFRRRYEEESLRLLRDRLNDERGFLRRLRLSFDLIRDVIGALPQAYRNSYADIASAVAITPHFDGIPSFQSLQKEPIRRGAFVVAGVLTFTALATFGYVIELPTPYPALQPNSPRSPIESVLERLNQEISPNTTDNALPQAPAPPATDMDKLATQHMSTSAALPAGAGFKANAARQTLPPVPQNPKANYSEHEPSQTPAVPSLLAPAGQQSAHSQPKATQIVARSLSPSNVQTLAAASASLSGKWIGSWRAAGGESDVPQWFTFKQDNAGLSGTGGPGSTEQSPIVHGSVAGDSVSFELNNGREILFYQLQLEGEELRGTLSIRSAHYQRTATVWLQRSR